MFAVASAPPAPSPPLPLVPKPGHGVPYSNHDDVNVFAPADVGASASSVLDVE